MILKKTIYSLAALALAVMATSVLLIPTTVAQETTPGYNNKIPESILTPDTVETKTGTLEFFDGIPNEKAAKFLLL